MSLNKAQTDLLRKLHKAQGLTEKQWEAKIFSKLFENLLSNGKRDELQNAVLEAAGQQELDEQLQKLQDQQQNNYE
ncbi:hypothetical protein SAMN04487792_1621 [Lactobacillus bombicola]|uniref:Uncharacterized protein n=1 Tax=Lactobacillus bombicola TaxID=1505723 RepID=A0A1I1TU93_9LACO|nr:hypothetical protein [Lactobacillus bombicola]SFD62152.1 hypothetical protein SAMN04487792_1621 [Lactobacillus bombicola]